MLDTPALGFVASRRPFIQPLRRDRVGSHRPDEAEVELLDAA